MSISKFIKILETGDVRWYIKPLSLTDFGISFPPQSFMYISVVFVFWKEKLNINERERET